MGVKETHRHKHYGSLNISFDYRTVLFRAKGDIFLTLMTQGKVLGFGCQYWISKGYKLYLSYATLREQELLRARKPEEGAIHARTRNLWTSLSEVLSLADYIFSYLHARLHIAERRILLLLSDGNSARDDPVSPKPWKVFRCLRTYMHKRESRNVSLPNSEEIMAEVRTADISFQHTCSLFGENCAIETVSVVFKKYRGTKLKILSKLSQRE